MTTSTNHPRLRYVERLFDRLAQHVVGVNPTGHPLPLPAELADLRRRTLEAVRRDLETSAVDGHARSRAASPTGTHGSGPTVLVTVPETGEQESVPVTSVEAAAMQLVDGDVEIDLVHEYASAAVTFVESLVGNLASWRARLDGLDALSNRVNLPRNPAGYCVVCTRWVPGTSSDRLRRGMCAADHRAWERAGRPELPDFIRTRAPQEDQMPDHDQEATACDR